jgi:hypothetical protein
MLVEIALCVTVGYFVKQVLLCDVARIQHQSLKDSCNMCQYAHISSQSINNV